MQQLVNEYSVISNLGFDNIKSIFIENNKMTRRLQREYQRAQCIALVSHVVKRVGIFKSSVQRAIKRLEETDDFHD